VRRRPCRDNNLDHVGIVVANDAKLIPRHSCKVYREVFTRRR
jgi:hypothetical protein